MIKVNLLSPEDQKKAALILKFQEAFRARSFSGRNPELGKMTNCPACGLRHRAAVSQCHVGGKIRYYLHMPEGSRVHLQGNPVGWRAKPGKLIWVPELKQFRTIYSGAATL